MSSPFENCSRFYRPDFKIYSNCTNVSNFCSHVEDLYSIDMTLRWAIFVIPCVMCTIALLMNIYIFYVLIPIYGKLDDRTKKRYVFLLSRALSSTMSVISIILLPVAILFTDYNFWIIAVFIIFDMLSFLSFLGGVVGTTVTTYVAVVHPVYYRHELSYRKCVLLVVLLWVSATIVAVGCGTIQAAFLAKDTPFHCDYGTCEKPTVYLAVCCISVTFAFTLGIQSFVIFSVFRHEKRSKERGDFSNTTKLMMGVKRRLISIFLVILMMAVFEITSAAMLVVNVFSLTEDNSICYQFSSSGSRLRFVIFSAVLTLLWVVSLFLDPIFTIIFDPVFTKEFQNHDIAAAYGVINWLNYYISTAVFAVSGILNTYAFLTGLYTYSLLETESRKQYAFVLSRSFSTIVAIVSLLILVIILNDSSYLVSFAFYAISFSFYNFSLYSLLISSIFISLLTYLGVVHPMFYRKNISLRLIYWMISFTFLFSAMTSIPLSLFEAASNAPGPITCDLHYCLTVVEWINYSMATITLSLTVFLTGFVVVALHWHYYKAGKLGLGSSEAMNRARIRLTWSFFALVFVCFIELFPIGMVIGFNQNDLTTCESFYRAGQLLVQSVVTSVETFVGSLIFFADPVVTIFFDKNISQTVKRQNPTPFVDDVASEPCVFLKCYQLLINGLYRLAVMAESGGGLFENCTRHFSFEDNFQKCTNTTDQCRLIKDISTAYSILTWFGFYTSSFICLLAVLVDFYCLIVTFCILRKLKEEYICVIIRLSSSILISICIVLIQSTIFTGFSFNDSFIFYAIFFVIYDFSIFSLLGSFIGVAVSTYFGVMRPMFYRRKFTLRAMYLMAAGVWITSACVAIPVGLFQAADTVDGPIRCDSTTCKAIIKWLVFSLVCVILLTALSTLAFVTISLYWHGFKLKKQGSVVSSASRQGRARLAWTTGIMVTLCFIELVPTGLLIGFKEYGFLTSCDNFYKADRLIIPAVISSFESFLGSVTFLLDPIINFFFDRHISKEVSSQIKSLRSLLFSQPQSSNDITVITSSSS